MQAKLPDINSAIVRHRSGALAALSQHNYALAATELSAINALLPEDYEVTIDSKLYQEKVKAQDVLICNFCEEPNEYSQVTFFNEPLENNLKLLFSLEKLSMWSCLKCKKSNPVEGSIRKIIKLQTPHYAECIPEPPRQAHFGNRMNFRRQFEKWFDIALNELENKIGEYRTDYAAQEAADHIDTSDEDDN